MAPAKTTIAERFVRYAWRLYAGGEVTSAWMRKRFNLSKMTAKRDMDQLMRSLPLKQNGPTRRGVERRLTLAKVVVRMLDE